MGSGLSTLFESQCSDHSDLTGGLKMCYFDRGFAVCSFILFILYIYQIVFVYYKCYGVPIIQIGKK